MASNAHKPNLTTIPIKDKEGRKVGEQPYLPAHEAITWFRADYPPPQSAILTFVDMTTRVVRAEIWINSVLVSTANVINPPDGKKTLEKLETGAVRRALAFLGYGTTAALAAEYDDRSTDEAGNSARIAEARRATNGMKKPNRKMAESAEFNEEPDELPELSWDDKGVLHMMLGMCQEMLDVPDMTLSEMARLAGISGDPKVVMRWSQKHLTPTVALAAIKAQFEFEMMG